MFDHPKNRLYFPILASFIVESYGGFVCMFTEIKMEDMGLRTDGREFSHRKRITQCTQRKSVSFNREK